MAALPAQGIAKITVNGEEYMPAPHEVNPELPEDMVWTQWPPNDLYMSDPQWYDVTGKDMIAQRRIWAAETNEAQIGHFRALLDEHPSRRLDMMFAAAVKGKADVIRFLLERGVKSTANEADGDDMTLVPLHAAAYQGHLECVGIFIEEVGLSPDTRDDMGGTPLMRACWGKQTDVVRYLIEKGADVMVRQKAAPGPDEEGVNAFEFAAGSGCVACAELVVARAQEPGVHAADLANAMALAVAAQADNLAMLELILRLGNYPLVNIEDRGHLVLTQSMKDSIEGAFRRALLQGTCKSLKPLFAYIDSRGEDGGHNWDNLKQETLKALRDAMLEFATRDDEEHRDAFVFVSGILLNTDSRFTSPPLQEKKDNVLLDAFFWACQKGCLDTVKLIDSMHKSLEVSQLSHVSPASCSSLYVAVAEGREEVVQYLFSEHGEQLDIHLGNGVFANGPTPLWSAVRNGHAGIIRLLLANGGPVDSYDSAKPEVEEPRSKKVVITATKTTRAPVRIISEAEWATENGHHLEGPAEKGGYTDSDRKEVRYVTLELTASDLKWWDKIQLRKSDEQLRSIENNGREIQTHPGAA
ncbi:Uu.00g021290.m01.CDS01 [Anthostomella pinea]|uniref:Uu.00g021290.m01.CDS01 n=1 Tax=Anthostomella pinea TaxID=933095 RepID=A0AAI8W0J7_9PEZI|nr:Uu.00g021290.m01.CDS01 [Anthostomella pinea]